MDAALNNLTSEQKQQIMIKAQQEANTSIMQSMMEQMVESCFDRCAGTSVCIYFVTGEIFFLISWLPYHLISSFIHDLCKRKIKIGR